MAEHCIIVDVDEYNELVRKSERIAAVERMLNCGGYVSEKELLAALDVKKGGESDGEV